MTETVFTRAVLINATISKVWDTVTNPDKINNWISDDDTKVISDWKPGSSILFRRKLYKATIEDKGVLLKWEKGNIFQYTHWSKIMRISDVPENYSIITLDFKANNDQQTKLTVTHSNLIAKASYEHIRFYWNVTLQIIKRLAE